MNRALRACLVALAGVMLAAAGTHLIMAGLSAIRSGDTSVFNLFTIIGLDLIWPKLGGQQYFLTGWLIVLIIWLVASFGLLIKRRR